MTTQERWKCSMCDEAYAPRTHHSCSHTRLKLLAENKALRAQVANGHGHIERLKVELDDVARDILSDVATLLFGEAEWEPVDVGKRLRTYMDEAESQGRICVSLASELDDTQRRLDAALVALDVLAAASQNGSALIAYHDCETGQDEGCRRLNAALTNPANAARLAELRKEKA